MSKTLHSSQSISERKFAEKLTILNERGAGILARIYNIKKTCTDSSRRPHFLSEKQLEAPIKHITKKFPNIDTKDKVHLTAISSYQKDIMSILPSYYNTFVDVMEFHDLAIEVITSLATVQFNLNITLNFDLTKGLLDLVAAYASIMILLGQVDDRKAIVGLYNIAHESTRGGGITEKQDLYRQPKNILTKNDNEWDDRGGIKSLETKFETALEEVNLLRQLKNYNEPSFPRLSQMFIDFEHPLKRMMEEFTPISKVVSQAVISLMSVYLRRNLPADQMRGQQILSLSGNPMNMLNPDLSGELPCETLSLAAMVRWILFGFLLCPFSIGYEHAIDLWRLALQDGYVLTLYRDEHLLIHSVFERHLLDLKTKDEKKRANEVSEHLNIALQSAGPLHRERRQFLRSALNELCLLLSDQPGLFGPKATTVQQALTLVRDEIHWMMKHSNVPTPKSKHKPNPEDYTDSTLPELLFLAVQLKAMFRKHRRVVQNYHLKFMAGFDAGQMREIVMRMTVCPEEESILMTSFVDTLSRLHGKEVDDRTEYDFQGLRMDWFRLQALTSVYKAPLKLWEQGNRQLAWTMNMVTVHSTFVDCFEEQLIACSDFSFFCFFFKQFEQEFNKCMKSLVMQRYLIAFPMLCAEFLNSTNPFCPEERVEIGDRAVSSINRCLELISLEVKSVMGQLCDDNLQRDELLHHFKGAGRYLQQHPTKLKKGNPKFLPQPVHPGQESTRVSREEVTSGDSALRTLVSLCFTVNVFPSITAWDHTFSPREYILPQLEDQFMKKVVSMLHYNSDTKEIARPSEVLVRVQSYVSTLRTLELYVNVDMTRVLTSVLLQETQGLDSKGEATIASIYTHWYSQVLLKHVSLGNICYSRSRQAFVSRKTLPFKAEEYSDVREMQSLAELIGPYGIRHMGERLMDQVSGQVKEIKKMVILNQDTLIALYTNRDKPEVFNELFRKLKNGDEFVTRATIVGIILAFRKLTLSTLRSVLEQRIPFMFTSILDFKDNLRDKPEARVADHMATASGIKCDVDPLLLQVMKNHCDKGKEDNQLWWLFLVFVGVYLPELAMKHESHYLPTLEGNENNVHCLAIAINSIAGAVFAFYGEKEQRERMREFLVFTSSRIMTLAKESEKEKDAPKAREAIYLLLDLFVEESPFLTRDLLESCFPYCLLRDAYNSVYRQPTISKKDKHVDIETLF